MEPTKMFTELQIKEKRVDIDALIQWIRKEQELGTENLHNADEALYYLAQEQVVVHLTDAKMWLGKMLEGRGSPFPAEFADKAK